MVFTKKIISFILIITVLSGLSGGIAAAITEKYMTYPLPNEDILRGKTVFIDAGHGNWSGGASINYTEHSAMLDIARLLEFSLKNKGAHVIMLRDDDTNWLLAKRVSIINKYSLELVRAYKEAELSYEQSQEAREKLEHEIAEIRHLEAIMQTVIDNPEENAGYYYNDPYDYSYNTVIHPVLKSVFAYCNHPAVYNRVVYISLHSNSTPSGSTGANGVDVFISVNASTVMHKYFNEYSDIKVAWSHIYASLLLDEVTAATGMRKNTIGDSAFYITRETNVPGVLIELGYHSNPSDRAKLQSDTYRRYMANAMTLATVEYFRQTSGFNTQPLPETDDYTAFTVRLYNTCLNRTPAQIEMQGWIDALAGRRITGTKMAHGFVFSAEMENKNLSNSDFAEVLYNALLGRRSDAKGKADWVEALDMGMSREDIYYRFAASDEYGRVCANYGVVR